MINSPRYRAASMAAGIHSLCSVLVALLAACIVFWVWYAYPYGELSGGRELFLLIVAVDVVCGPLLTFVLFNPHKAKKELGLDLSLVVIVQLAALSYGLWTVWEARPLYLVHEVDRFRVISRPDIDEVALDTLPAKLKPQFWSGPQTVGIRPPKDVQERNKVLFESAAGGRDYGARPEFYVSYDDAIAKKALLKAVPLAVFLQKQPQQTQAAQKILQNKGGDFARLLYVPVVGRKDWVAVLNPQGQIEGFLPGDGF